MRRFRIFSSFTAALSKAGCCTSKSFTEHPAVAATCAIPEPMVPAPITPIFIYLFLLSSHIKLRMTNQFTY